MNNVCLCVRDSLWYANDFFLLNTKFSEKRLKSLLLYRTLKLNLDLSTVGFMGGTYSSTYDWWTVFLAQSGSVSASNFRFAHG